MASSMLGTLFIVATPLGNLQDITFRAIETLKTVSYVAAEDTRHSRPLLQHFGINTPMLSLHDFNEQAAAQKILRHLQEGESVALISDAGTPLISDPGYLLVREARKLGVRVVPIPGACALVAALCVSGLATDRFLFAGFLASKNTEREKQLNLLRQETSTLIFYEAPHRIMEMLQSLVTVFGGERNAVIARELTKLHESVLSNTLDKLVQQFSAHVDTQRGEFVVLVEGAKREIEQIEIPPEARRTLEILLQELPLKQAVLLASKISGVRKNVLYDLALKK